MLKPYSNVTVVLTGTPFTFFGSNRIWRAAAIACSVNP
jgi:hypothetical protein